MSKCQPARGINYRSERGDKSMGVLGKLKALNQLLERWCFSREMCILCYGTSILIIQWEQKGLSCAGFVLVGTKTGSALCAGMCAQHCLYHVSICGKTSPAYRVAGYGDREPQQSPFDPAGMGGLPWHWECAQTLLQWATMEIDPGSQNLIISPISNMYKILKTCYFIMLIIKSKGIHI